MSLFFFLILISLNTSIFSLDWFKRDRAGTDDSVVSVELSSAIGGEKILAGSDEGEDASFVSYEVPAKPARIAAAPKVIDGSFGGQLRQAVADDDKAQVEFLVKGLSPTQVFEVENGGVYKTSPLISAAGNNRVEIIRVLARAGFNSRHVDDLGYNATTNAALHGHVDALEALYEFAPEDVACATAQGTPLRKAVDAGRFGAVRFLVEHGGDKDEVVTPKTVSVSGKAREEMRLAGWAKFKGFNKVAEFLSMSAEGSPA